MNYLKIAGGVAFLTISVLAGCASSHGRGCSDGCCGTCQPAGPSYAGDAVHSGSGSTDQYQPAPAGSSSGPAYTPPAYSAPPAGSGGGGSGGR